MVGERYRSNHQHPDPSDAFEKEVLDHYELNRGKHNDERDTVQKKTFTKWVNKHLSKTGQKVEDLFVDLRDGYALIALLEALTGERIQKENGFTRFHRIQNVQYCLDFLKKKNIKLVNIRPEDIVEGNGKLTLGLIWTIILNFQVSVIRQRLLMESQHEQQMSGSMHKSSFSQLDRVELEESFKMIPNLASGASGELLKHPEFVGSDSGGFWSSLIKIWGSFGLSAHFWRI
ncbi:hypothetical protein L3Y34_016467 [Caenorhabditis briggsae]|uniref:Calponin-homology (CH) domain-containing protein n=1 Tax=Caenorhabditis briggsae TaxID=6238 RepID=A0AAE9DWC7_CAEBR|nr:hypothetical protein L3Y34_016467 [Caenorhabditis briggsae]